ncbi:alpha/beta fold hydrolase [Ralstonia pseudosolanacearum]|uniref:alpha/beta hydrolase family protein n=1 Tax=Ralstonia pseudosolanacearum TaxID=1310165 RepID=UPI002005556F|nr:alpha/beta fold hydrolase [Ralstonia pseudosolanacearum]MCK4153048.1 alpha/beta fold hydrolase [Ralstonia pseudosolanacearum]
MHTAAFPVSLTAADGYVLGGCRYPADTALKGRLVVAGATAVPQGFYRRFAQFAGTRGFETLTFDYRGIGQSRPPSLHGLRTDFLDWARLDLAAAVDTMADGAVPLYVVGHSYGGHAFGLLPNHRKVAGFCVFGTGAGWHGYMPLGERLRVLAMWNAVLPVLTWWKGYCPWKMLGLGEDLPVGVYRQWRHWCRFPRYLFDDPAMRGIEQAYADVRTPIVAVNALDDLWAPPASRDAFMQGYRNAPLTRKDLDPRQIGGKVGHMGYFRQAGEPLWERMLGWFSSLPRTTATR